MATPQDRIKLQAYDPSWPARYEDELARIKAALPAGVVRRAEHIGSTAVPGMLAKPVVDILLGVDDSERARKSFPPILEKLGYAFWPDDPKRDRLFFVKGLPPNGPRTFHILVTTPDSAIWDRVLFRDYLRAHPEEAKRYQRLKEDLAAKFPDDREAYSEGKTEYHESVVAKARAAGQGMTAEEAHMKIRKSARIVVLSPAGAVLLVRYHDSVPVDPTKPELLTYWVPPGGGVDKGESFEQAAIRELEEETGIELSEIGPQVWSRERQLMYRGELKRYQERYFIAWADPPRLLRNRTREKIEEIRWWTLDELRASTETFLPEGFVELVAPVMLGDVPSAPTGMS